MAGSPSICPATAGSRCAERSRRLHALLRCRRGRALCGPAAAAAIHRGYAGRLQEGRQRRLGGGRGRGRWSSGAVGGPLLQLRARLLRGGVRAWPRGPRSSEDAWPAWRGARGLAARCRHCRAAQTCKLGRSTGSLGTAGLAERAPCRTSRPAGRPRAHAPVGGGAACAGAAPKPGGTLTGAPKPAAPPLPSRSSSERLGLAASAGAPAAGARVSGRQKPYP